MTTTDTTPVPTGAPTRAPTPPARGGAGVVVGYDGSPSAVAAVHWAAAEALRRGAVLTVLNAVDLFGTTSGMLPPMPDLVEESQDVSALLADQGAALARSVARVPREVRTAAGIDHPVTALVEASAGAELVVVGNRGRGAVTSALLGSVAFTVSADAHCPVVVVRGDVERSPGPHRPVVVGVDDSPGARAALRFAAETAARAGATLELVAAWRLPDALTVEMTTGVDPGGDDLTGVRRAAEEVVHRAVAEVRAVHPELQVTGDVVEEAAVRALVRASERAGLVVVGARGAGCVAGLLLGSVSHATIHGAECPVAVVRPDPSPDGEHRPVEDRAEPATSSGWHFRRPPRMD